jgi:hypothetical protein
MYSLKYKILKKLKYVPISTYYIYSRRNRTLSSELIVATYTATVQSEQLIVATYTATVQSEQRTNNY